MLVMALLRGSARRGCADTLRSPGRTACGDCRSAGAGRCTGCGQGERVDLIRSPDSPDGGTTATSLSPFVVHPVIRYALNLRTVSRVG